jgi:EAL domain-containing protein (putative c-di-GMP-specific phosphodiesterase class I)
VSRRGGDEFVVLLSEVQRPEDAAICARRILQSVALPHSIDQRELFVTTSIGVSVYPDDGFGAESLIKNADTAMYQAKESGRQCYRFFKASMNAPAIERQFIEENLRHALERNELALHYQPKIDLKTRAIVGVEALLRWTHSERGPIAPKKFIPVAEDCGLILPIGNWVLREACRQARAWIDAKLPGLSMAVNISSVQFHDARFFEAVLVTLNEMGLEASCLELELTESVLMKRAEATASVLQSLRNAGMQVVIDDFGTGYSSLSYLQRFPIDALKIDESFVRQIARAEGPHSIVCAAIGMARNLELRVVAEGVETAEELSFLHAEQCHQGQGHYFSPALPAAELERVLRHGIPERGIPGVVGA